jgi:hypothetical protein
VAGAGVDLAQDMLDAMAGVSADEVYGGPPASFRPLETYAGELEARAVELGCPNRIRAAVQNSASGFQAQGEVARLVRELMRIDGIFNT